MDWDEPLSDEDQQQWLEIAENIQEARCLQIPRQYFPTVGASEHPDRPHIFANASLTAYRAVAFATVHPLLWRSPESHPSNH